MQLVQELLPGAVSGPKVEGVDSPEHLASKGCMELPAADLHSRETSALKLRKLLPTAVHDHCHGLRVARVALSCRVAFKRRKKRKHSLIM